MIFYHCVVPYMSIALLIKGDVIIFIEQQLKKEKSFIDPIVLGL
jgi:hypothetical protein